MYRLTATLLSIASLAACSTTRTSEPPNASTAPYDEAAWAAFEDRWIRVETKPTDPIDELSWRAVICNFLLGELSGDEERDSNIRRQTTQMRCFTQEADSRLIDAAYADDPEARARLKIYHDLTGH